MITLILFLVGLYFLVKGADWLVDGASSLARRLGVSALVVGLTIVAFGTSSPELVVNLFASFQGNTDIAIGNVLGSNVVSLLLILGISAVFYPLMVSQGTVWREIPFSLLAVVALGFLVSDVVIDGAGEAVLTRTDGLILLSFFVVFMYYVYGIAKNNPPSKEAEQVIKNYSTIKSLGFVVMGLVLLGVGAKFIVDAAVVVALQLGLSEALIGLTIVAVGTSLPEIAASIVAARRGQVEIAVGNVVGSNIFNIFLILGVSALVQPLPFSEIFFFDLWVVIIATMVLFLALFIGRKYVIERWQGIVLLVLYVVYLGYHIMSELS
jgi:cation:H+ antiporter